MQGYNNYNDDPMKNSDLNQHINLIVLLLND